MADAAGLRLIGAERSRVFPLQNSNTVHVQLQKANGSCPAEQTRSSPWYSALGNTAGCLSGRSQFPWSSIILFQDEATGLCIAALTRKVG